MNPMKMIGKQFGESIGDVGKVLEKLVELQEENIRLLKEIRDTLQKKDE